VWVNFCPALWVNYTPAVTIYQEIRREGGFFNGRAIYKGGWRLPENAVKEFLKIKGFI
jgi:hypothetical protein